MAGFGIGSGGKGTTDYPSVVNSEGILSTGNSNSTPLTNGSTFEGTAELNNLPAVLVFVATDQNGVYYLEFSTDGTNWDSSLSYNYDTNRINPPHVLEKGSRYFRVRFENNSGSDQTFFRLSTSYGSFNKLTSSINSVMAETFDAIATRPTNYNYEVAKGKRQGDSTQNKFGFNEDVDTGSPEILASYGGAFDPNTNIIKVAQTVTITYNNTVDGTGRTGALTVLTTYIDDNALSQTAITTLDATGSVVSGFDTLGINRSIVLSNGGLGWNASDITFTATTDGTIQARIPAQQSVTQQCIFHTQINHTLLLDWLFLNCLKLAGGGTPRVTFTIYSWSRVTLTRYEVFRYSLDTTVRNDRELTPNQPFVIGGREVVWIEVETTVNNTVARGRFSGIESRNS